MSLDYVHWPTSVLTPRRTGFQQRAFTRSGGLSLGGVERATRTDRGFWHGAYEDVVLRARDFAGRRVWAAIRTALNGRSGLVVVPVCSTAQLVAGAQRSFSPVMVDHSDGAGFSDGTSYAQANVVIEMAEAAAIGATTLLLRSVHNPAGLSGIRVSYQHALYETGRVLETIDDDTARVEVFPAVRMAIPSGVTLEAERPTCLCRLASDGEMDIAAPAGSVIAATVRFVEAVDYWNDLAAG